MMPRSLTGFLPSSSSSSSSAAAAAGRIFVAGPSSCSSCCSCSASSHGDGEEQNPSSPSNQVLPSPPDFAHLLRACSNARSLPLGLCIHDLIIRSGLDRNPFIRNLVIDMYGRCHGSLPFALRLFDSLPCPDIFSWNFIIRACTHHGLYEEALRISRRMLCHAAPLPDEYVFVSVLSVYASVGAIHGGKLLHAQISSCELRSKLIVSTALVNMYARCGSLGDARKVFDSIPERDVVCWNTMMGACILYGKPSEAIHLFGRLHQEGFLPNKASVSTLIDACVAVGGASQSMGKHVHASLVTTDLGSDIAIRLALANMYSTGVNLRDFVVDVSSSPNTRGVDAESTLLSSYAQRSIVDDAVDTFRRMQQKEILPERYAFASMISACSSQSAFSEGEKMHAYIAGTRLESDLVVGTALVNMYGKCGKVGLARSLFDKMQSHDVISWTAMIGAYAQSEDGSSAFELFREMKQRGIKPNKVTLAAVFDACTSHELLEGCKDIHNGILGGEVELDPYVGTALINMYGRFQHFEDAEKMFDIMPTHDVIMWNARITASARNGEGKAALKIFRDMQEQGMMPTKVTFVSTCNVCHSLAEGKRFHTKICVNRLEPDVVLATALINMYGRCGCLDDAKMLFDAIPQKDVVSWTAIMTVYAHNGRTKQAFRFFDKMLAQGLEPDEVSCISILSACVSKTGIDDGRLMHMRVVACALDSDVSVMNGLIVMYGKCGSMDDAVNTFEKVCDSSRETYVSILSACSHQVDLHEGRRIHGLVTKTGHETEVSVANALINIYSKCGSLQEAASVFEKMPEWNVASWTTMITSHAQHGHGEFALHLFDKMQSEGLLPNKVTFVNMLNAFSHAGMIDEGYHCLGYLNHGISSMSPIEDHYNCIIDLLARAGRLSEAENLIRQMPLTPSVISWTSFLNGCRQHLDVERGEYAAEIIFRMEPTNPAPYLTLYNLYIATGRLQDAANVMCKLRENSLLKHEVRQCVA